MHIAHRSLRPLLIAGIAALSLCATRGVAAAQPASCTLSFVSPLVVPLSGTFGGIAIDDGCRHVYLTNTSLNRVEVFSLETLTLQAPIQVGSAPAGLDITPDGSLLYVANSGGNNISVVDLVHGVELRKVAVPTTFFNDTPYSIAIASNGLALFSTTFAGSGFGARMMQLDLATDAVMQRTDFWFSGTTTERTHLSASDDKSTIGIVAGDISSGPVFRYSVGTNTFSPEKPLQTFISDVSLDATGSTFLVTPGAFVLDAALNLLGTIDLEPGWGGNAVNPSGTIGYRSIASRIDVLDLPTFLKTGELPLGDSVDSAYFINAVGHMDISRDGRLLGVITDNGLSLVLSGAAPPVDTIPPTLTVPADIVVAATSPAGAIVTFVVTATDDTDPSPIVSCTPASGSLFPIGTTTVTCTAADATGNTATATFTVRVIGPEELVEDLLDAVVAGRLGPGGSLAAKLRGILAALENDKPAAACGLSRALLNEVRAQSDKHLSSADAAYIAGQIGAVRTLLGCGS